MLTRRGRALEDDGVDRIVQDPAMRNPLRLRMTMEYYLRTEVFLPGTAMDKIFDLLLEKVEQEFWDKAPGLVRKTFSSIARSRRGLMDSELMSITGVNRHMWSQFIADVTELRRRSIL